jgi:arsenite methyltransferase
MMNNHMPRPQYGIDAPDLLRLFFTAGTIALTALIVILLTSMFGQPVRTIASVILGIATIYLIGMGCLMLYFSKVAKLIEREKLLNLVEWSGRELVLDVGCGRGLMLIGAAKRLSSGKAIGIDLWQQQDQAENNILATQTNIEIEGVADRTEVKTADMRELPFPENYFDIITSNWAIHNLEAELDRQRTLDEIIRVLKPGGIAILADIVNQSEYATHLEFRDMVDVQLHNHAIRDAVLKTITFGSFAPSTVTARKTA